MAITRSRSKKVNIEPKKAHPKKKTVQNDNVASRTRAKSSVSITVAKRQPKPKKKAKKVVAIVKKYAFSLGEIVYAKVSGYSPWPAFVKEIFFQRKKIFLVEFFGDTTESFVSEDALTKFYGNDAIGKAHIKKRGYKKAFEEAKVSLKKSKI